MNNQTAIVLNELKSLLDYVDQFGTHTSDKRVTSARALYDSLSNVVTYRSIYDAALAGGRIVCNNTLTDNLSKRDDTLTPRPDSREIYGDGE